MKTKKLNGKPKGKPKPLRRRWNDTKELRAVYSSGVGESMGANAVINLCDEVDDLRVALKSRGPSLCSHCGGSGWEP